MSTVRRFERLDFSSAKLVQDGEFLRVDGKVARAGVQEYRDSAGGIRRELRLPEDVMDSVASFALVPLTNTHPASMVKPDNARQVVIGAVGAAKFDGEWVKAPLAVYAADAIAAIKGGRVQLSTGYQCEVIDEAGEWKGERYDCRQTNIKVNHVALVDVARAGPDARLRLDAGDAVAEIGSPDLSMIGSASPLSPTTTERKHMAIKVKLDGGFEIEVADANAEAAIRRTIEEARLDGMKKATVEKERADKAELGLSEEKKKTSELQAKLDSEIAARKTDGEKMVKCDECDGKGGECKSCSGKGEMKADAALDPKRRADALQRLVSARAARRASLLAQVGEDLSSNEKLDDKSDLEVKQLWLDKRGFKLDGKDEAYVSAYFDAEMTRAQKDRPTALAQVRSASDPVAGTSAAPRADEGPSKTPEQARERMLARNQAALVK